jgi:glutamate synthase (NADPH/NADH) large chain
LRTSTGLVVETGSAREVHHFALLAAYGAEAMHPYLAMQTLSDMHASLSADLSAEKAIYNYTKAIGKGLMKVMSKMGISTYMSYCGSQIFEAVGLSSKLVEQYFTGTASNIEGIDLFDIADEGLRMHREAFSDDPVLSARAAKRTSGRPTRSPSCSMQHVRTALQPTRIMPLTSTSRIGAS